MQRCLVLLLALALTGCATAPSQQSTEQERAAPEPAFPQSDYVAEDSVLYHLLVAELAGNRGAVGQASDAYLEAAKRSNDPQVAARAARVALYAGRNNAAATAAERWLQLDAGAIEAHQVLAVIDLRANRIPAAADHLDQVIAASESPAEGFTRIAGLVQRQVPEQAALEVLQVLVQRYPGVREAHYVLGEAAMEAGETDVALEAANNALDTSPEWRDGLLLRAQAQLEAGNAEAGLADLQQLLEQSPDDFDLRLHYARTLLDLSRTEEALAEFQRLMEERPGDTQVVYAAALLAMDAGKLERAREYLLQLVNSGERTEASYYYLGRIAEQEGDYPGAIRWYSRVNGDYRGEAQLRISVALAKNGEIDKARERLQSLRQSKPDRAVQTYAVEGDLLRTTGRLQESLSVYNQALAQYPDNMDLLYGRAMTLVRLDRIEQAESDLRTIIQAEPDNAHALNALGYTLVDQTPRVQEGMDLIRRAYGINSDDPAIIDSMGWAHYRLGNLQKAVDFLEEAHRKSNEAEIAAHLGEVLWQLGHRERARQIWEEALERDPDNPFIQETMKRLTE